MASDALSSLLKKRKHGYGMNDFLQLSDGSFSKQVWFDLKNDDDQKAWISMCRGETPFEPGCLCIFSGDCLYDVLGVRFNYGTFFSQRAVDAFTAGHLTGWTAVPIELPFPTKPQGVQYYRLEISGRANECSTKFGEPSDEYSSYFDVDSWDGSDFFQIGEDPTIFISPRVIQVLKESGFSGWTARPVYQESFQQGVIYAPIPRRPRLQIESEYQQRIPLPPSRIDKSPVQIDDLKRLIRSYKLERLEAQILSSVRTSFRFHVAEPTENCLALGATRIGGEPDLPEGAQWPHKKKQPHVFLGQIRLEDFSEEFRSKVLPAEGLLSFFVAPETDEEGKDWMLQEGRCWEVFFAPTGKNLVRISPPDSIPAAFEWPPYSMVGAPVRTFPDLGSPIVKSWKLKTRERSSYRNFLESIDGYQWHDEPDHRIFGYADCEDFNDAIPDANPDAIPDDGSFGVASSMLLLKLDYDRNFGMQWGDSGDIRFSISDRDALKCNFSKAKAVSEFA